jgi:hypothetical protein
MATSYTATFSGACRPAAPCIFDAHPTQKTGALSTGIGHPLFTPLDGTVMALSSTTYIGGAQQTIIHETSGDPNLP